MFSGTIFLNNPQKITTTANNNQCCSLFASFNIKATFMGKTTVTCNHSTIVSQHKDVLSSHWMLCRSMTRITYATLYFCAIRRYCLFGDLIIAKVKPNQNKTKIHCFPGIWCQILMVSINDHCRDTKYVQHRSSFIFRSNVIVEFPVYETVFLSIRLNEYMFMLLPFAVCRYHCKQEQLLAKWSL